jgi:pimeloyl-ACP methyl ester carboxylesterase
LRPQPRGIGASIGPWDGVKLEDLAADIAAVIEANGGGPAFVVGHAFGNRVARTLAALRPDLVRAVSLVAANVGHNPSPPDVRAAIRLSADVTAPDAERIKAMQFVFFAPGNDASVWLKGWHPDVLAAQRIAGDLTPRTLDYAAGTAPVLYIQPSWRMWRMLKTTRERSVTASLSWSFRTRRMASSPSSRTPSVKRSLFMRVSFGRLD